MFNQSTSQDLDKINKFMIMLILWLVITFTILSAIVWVLLYSTYLANLPSIITLRENYQKYYWKFEEKFSSPQGFYPPFDPIYTIQVKKIEADGKYDYSAQGRFESIDYKNMTLTLNGIDGNTYNFSIENSVFDGSINIIQSVSSEVITLPIGPGKPISSNIFNQTSLLIIGWQDTRTLTQIYNTYGKSASDSINQNFPLIILIRDQP
jgi:hypothetical protein